MATPSSSSRNQPKRHKWAIDLHQKEHKSGQVSRVHELAPPVGWLTKHDERGQGKQDVDPELIDKKSREIALGPIKQLPMNLFIMWMAGSTISMFPIMMIGMMFFRPIQALMGAQAVFKQIEGDRALLYRFVYLVGNLAALGLAVYKCQVMGLLPTHPSDWLAFVEPQQRMEWSGGGMVL